MKLGVKIKAFLVTGMLFLCAFSSITAKKALAVPYYSLYSRPMGLRGAFTTYYEKSSAERKHNVKLAAKSLNDALIAPGDVFSFNQTVGERTEKRGYKSAKIIYLNKFIDGVGGGVCQVSTTLYNALLLANVNVFERHSHSLAVSYVEPSFDAMVNSGSADLRFFNDTKKPMYIKTFADDKKLTIKIYGEQFGGYLVRESVKEKEIEPEPTEIILDEKNEYQLADGEEKVIAYPKRGLKSKANISYFDEKGNLIFKKTLSNDVYNAVRGVVVRSEKKVEQN